MKVKDVIQKAAYTSSGDLTTGGGILNRQQMDQFILLLSNHASFASAIKLKRVNHPKGQIDRLDLSSPVTRKAVSEASENTDTRKPTNSNVQYDTVKTASLIDITTEVEEDNIEGKGIRQTIMELFARRIAIDQDQLLIQGDDSLVGSDVTTLLLQAYDGLNVQSTSCPNYLDANGLGVSLKLFKDGLAKLPTQFKRMDRSMFRFWIAPNPKEDLEYIFGSRLTSGGDNAFTKMVELAPFGIPLEPTTNIPTNQSIGTAATDGTFVILTDPDNMIFVVQREMQIHFEFRPRKDLTEVTIYLRTAFCIEDLNRMVKIRSVSADASGAYA